MDYQADAATQPGKARVKDQIDETRARAGGHAAFGSVHALLRSRQCCILIDRQGCVGSAVPVPIAVVCVVKSVMLRPHILRHPRNDTQEKTHSAIEPSAAK